MRSCIVDTEVFAYDNIAVFKDLLTGFHYVFHNDPNGVREFMDEDSDTIYYTANGKHYDRFILQAMYNLHSPMTIKDLNDFIIRERGEGWDYPLLKDNYFKCNIVDLFDDMQMGLSLKSIEAHLGMDIEESQVDFDIDRPLTYEELQLTIKYCTYDVDATHELLKLRKNYLETKMRLGAECGLSPERAMALTNARLTAVYLGAKKTMFYDERKYVFPTNIDYRILPDAVVAFYQRMWDVTIPDEVLFSDKYQGSIGDCTYTLGYGGIHGDCGRADIHGTDDEYIVIDDVGSYYPHLMTINGYCSRAMKDPKRFEHVLDTRMKAKAEGNKQVANDLKLVVNTTYGATLSPWNDLYDPLMGRSVCISGQLYLLELAIRLHKEAHCEMIQLNTDGIVYKVKAKYLRRATAITEEWQQRTGFELERDFITHLVQKDVNNYLAVFDNGAVKKKGAYLVRGISKAGAFNINNNYPIVAKALEQYFVNGIPVDETIFRCEDPLQFQIIAKASHKYSEVYQMVNGHRVYKQKVNRVYASTNCFNGTLFKVHKQSGSVTKIPSLPENCIIDNKNEISIDDIDRGWYVKLAKKQLADYTGEPYSNKKNGALTRKLNQILKGLN